MSTEIQQVIEKVASGGLRGSSNAGVLDGYQVMSAEDFMSGEVAQDVLQGNMALSGGLGRRASKTGRYAIIVAVPNEDSEESVRLQRNYLEGNFCKQKNI